MPDMVSIFQRLTFPDLSQKAQKQQELPLEMPPEFLRPSLPDSYRDSAPPRRFDDPRSREDLRVETPDTPTLPSKSYSFMMS